MARHKGLASVLVTHHLLTETPPSPGLTLRLQSGSEPRRREPPPGGGLSEGAPNDSRLRHPETAPSRSERRPCSAMTAGPSRADEGGGPDAGADSTQNWPDTGSFRSLTAGASRIK